jgi:uncharacterized protein
MRIVLDTNVFVSAILKVNSLPFAAVQWVDHHGGLLKSLETERQLIEVLARPHIARVAAPHFRDDITKMLAHAGLVTIAERIAACRDPADDKFLELAVSGKADVIVSGDSDLLALNPFRGIPILAPAAFVQQHCG